MSQSINTKIQIPVLEVRHLTPSGYVLRMKRGGLDFEAGQYIALGLPGKGEMREYSVYSGEHDDFLEVLIKEVDDGLVSRQLKNLDRSGVVEMDGPFGFFTLSRGDIESGKEHLFIASGTGIAPFHSYVKTYNELNYRILHGVRYGEEAYESSHYDKNRYILCTSRDDRGDFRGHVTEYLEKNPVGAETSCYLCGNSNMIHDVYDILTGSGVPAVNIHAEVYF